MTRCRRRIRHEGLNFKPYTKGDGVTKRFTTEMRLTCAECGGKLGMIAYLYRRHRGDREVEAQ
jgi:ribosomal protein L44E